MKKALTDAGIRSLEPGIYFDTRTPAFGIRVGSQRKTWIATRGRGRRVITLGHYPAVSLKEARARAFGAFSTPEDNRPTITFAQAKEEFLGQDRWRAQSKRVLISTLAHFDWSLPVSKVTPRHVVDSLDQIAGKSARAHALKDIRTFFNWCIPRYLTVSPTVGIKMEKQASRERVLSDVELVRVWGACWELGTIGAIVRLLILTGQRRTEIGSLRRSWMQDDRIVWPPEATKNGREHSLPLTSGVATLISQVPYTGEFVFCARLRADQGVDRPFNGWSAGLETVHLASGTENWTLHDLRRTFATGLARNGTPIHVTEKLLNHVSGSLRGVAGIYNRYEYWDDQIEALTGWQKYLEKLQAGATNDVP